MRIPTWVAIATMLSLVSAIGGGTPAAERAPTPELRGPYLGQKPPGTRPVLFAPGMVSTDLHDDFSPAFTPDGNEVFFRCVGNGRMIILHMSRAAGRWTGPEIAPFSGEYNDLGVFLSHDGSRLFFSSERPASSTDTTADLDLFVVERTDHGWGDPRPLFPNKSRSGNVFGCSIDSEGTVYSYARRADGFGGYDIYRSRRVDGVYSQTEALPAPINSPRDESSPCIAHDGSFLVYSSNGGPAGDGGSGLYVTFRKPDHSWSEPANLTRHLGMTLPAKFAGLSPDSRYLFFVVPESREANRRLGRRWEIDAFRGAGPRHGGGNVYWVDASVLDALRPGR